MNLKGKFGELVEALLWVALIAGFAIGSIATQVSSPDYRALYWSALPFFLSGFISYALLTIKKKRILWGASIFTLIGAVLFGSFTFRVWP